MKPEPASVEATAAVDEMFEAAKAYAEENAPGHDPAAGIDRLGLRLIYFRDHLPTLLDNFAKGQGKRADRSSS
jgi:hypothetical protein